MALLMFLILGAYYMLKTAREIFILSEGGAEVKSYSSAGQALLLLALVPAYAAFASRVNRERLITWVTLFFVANLELFWLAGQASAPYLGIAFFVWVGVFNNAVVAQFWSFANDLHTPERGARLFPVIATGATLGSPVGAWTAARLFEAGVPALSLLHLAALLLLCSLAGYLTVEGSYERQARPASDSEDGSPTDGFTRLARDPYLRLVCLLLLLLNVVNTTGEYILGRSVLASIAQDPACASDAAREACIGRFFGDYYFWVNIVTIVIQSLLVSRVVRAVGIAGVLLALPLASLVTYSLVLAGAGFPLFRWAKTIENATDYSAMNTARQMLWLPTSRADKYAAKQGADTFVVRAGDVMAAGLVLAGTTWMSLDRQGFAAALLVVVITWAGVAWLLVRAYRRRTRDAESMDPRSHGDAAPAP